MKTWETNFQVPVKALFFGELNVSVTIPECEENRRSCMAVLDSTDTLLATPYQDHTATCVVIDSKPEKAPVADAYVTKTPGLAIGILTADCAPILFAGTDITGVLIVGAAHAGARGALKGIIQSTVKAMRGLGAQNIAAVIGPCIRQDSYEVGPEFYEEFVKADPNTKNFFNKNGSLHFDLPGYCAHLLTKENVTFADVNIDTYKDLNCFSYRRATHRKEPDYGRQLSAIMISSSRQ